ncbi:hypothetical protein [Neorhizobium tomejilense]|uniref:hypothetical protein n=1 Tax=Neorhizobium tomejilense TaxID=2093828 RepID=UPI003ECD19C4
MNAKRRNLFIFLGSALLGWPSLAAGDRKSPATAPTRSTVTPRHVLCFLGGKDGLAVLRKTAQTAIRQFGEGFSIDESYSMDTEDDRMELSFAVCWDRVAESAFSEADERAVLEHRSVLYVLGPPMMAEKTIAISATALRFVQFMLDGGALAAKGESAGVAHGIDRWKELADQAHDATISNDSLALASICRLAFARRPIGDPTAGQSMETVGFHLVGLPDMVIDEVKLANPKIYTNGDQIEIADFIDAIATRMTEYGVGETIARDRHSLSDDERYEDDSYKFNPFGVITIKSVSL